MPGKQYTLSGRAVQQIGADHNRLRSMPDPQPLNQRSPLYIEENELLLGQVQSPIAAGTVSPSPLFASGSVKLYALTSGGGLLATGGIQVAFNFLARTFAVGDFVFLGREKISGRWMILQAMGVGLAQWIYFKATASFTTASSSFAADILHYFDGSDPRPTRWASDNHGTIHNPPVNGGASFFFAGASGDHGFALWHDDDAVTPGAPVGYWCEQLRCQA